MLTDSDLKEMGVKALGPRRRMLAAFAVLGGGGGGAGAAQVQSSPTTAVQAASPQPSATPASDKCGAGGRPAMLQRLRRFYEQYHPSRLVPASDGADVNLDLEVILDQWTGREEELFVALERKYCAAE